APRRARPRAAAPLRGAGRARSGRAADRARAPRSAPAGGRRATAARRDGRKGEAGMTADDVVAERLPETVREALLAPLFDHHTHPLRRDDLVRGHFEAPISPSGAPAPPSPTHVDSPAGPAERPRGGQVLRRGPHATP